MVLESPKAGLNVGRATKTEISDSKLHGTECHLIFNENQQ